MILNLFRKNRATEAVYAVYAAIVAQSRQPKFYAEWNVPDTVTGRFDMISLHMALLFRRLRKEGKAVDDFAQAVFDLFFKDVDQLDESSFKSRKQGGSVRLGFPLSEQIWLNTSYTLSFDDIYEIGPNASRAIVEAEGGFLTSALGTSNGSVM